MRRRHEDGFTLVEVLTSLLIFSTAILGLMHAGTENIRAVGIIEQKQTASIIADNQLILAMNNLRIQNTGTTKEVVEINGQKWEWELKVEETEQAGFGKLTINIRQDDSERVILTRTAFFNSGPNL
jgi:general secretion pathway protein I